MSCQVSVLYFARSAELAGLRCETLRVPRQVTSLQLWEEIVRVHPRSTCLLEISSWSCSLETRLPSSHQLVEAESAWVLLGTTRNNFEGKKVIHLEYEAYTSMAESEIKKICRDVRQKWPSIKHIAVHHRLGVVPITEASVIIAVSSPHRAESLEAVTYCINTLKASVPIWKKASSSLSSFPTMLLLKCCIVLFRHVVGSSQSCCQEMLLLTNSVHSIKCRA
ncbi:molybdopterin synthase catalytic subunit isoform 2-T2 [Alca torda]